MENNKRTWKSIYGCNEDNSNINRKPTVFPTSRISGDTIGEEDAPFWADTYKSHIKQLSEDVFEIKGWTYYFNSDSCTYYTKAELATVYKSQISKVKSVTARITTWRHIEPDQDGCAYITRRYTRITISGIKSINVTMAAEKVGEILGIKPILEDFYTNFDYPTDASPVKYKDLVKQPDLKITNNEILCAANEYFKQYRKDNSFNAFKSGAAWMYYRLIDKAGRDNFQKEAYKTGQLTLDDAIKHCEDMEQIMETEAVREEHRLLKNWLIELKNYRETSNDKN